MEGERSTATVAELQTRGILFVEDGNHGEYRPLAHEFVKVGTPFIRPDDLEGGRVDFSSCDRINDEALARVRKGKGRAGDIVFTHRATVGRIARIGPTDPPFVANPGVTVWRSNAPAVLDPTYLYFFMQTTEFMNQIWAEAGNTDTFPYVSLTQQRGLLISMPRIERQREIAHILGTLDDKIELNRRMNETLEAMARALFKSWFVDFNPVRAKAEGRDPGLPKHLADLFPDSFEDSEMGQIPKGWSAVPLYDIATYINGAAYAAFQPNDERRGLPIIKIAELKAGVTSQTKYSEVPMPEKYRITKGDILFSWSGNPDTSIDTFVWSGTLGWLNQHIFKVLPRRHHERAFVLSTLRALRPVFAEIARNKQTTGLGHVTAEDMKRLLVARPDDQVMRAWNTIAAPFHERIFRGMLESNDLVKLRDTLLPKLISGELRVKDAERFLKDRGL